MKTCKSYFISLVKSTSPIWIAFTALITLQMVLITAVFKGFAQSSAYSAVAMLFPMVYVIIIGNKLIAEKVDKCTMSGYLTSNISRVQIALTSALFLIVSLIAMWTLVTAISLLAGVIAGRELAIGTILTLNSGALVYQIAIGGICFCASCLFNTSKGSLAVGGGIAIIFYLLDTMGGFVDSLDFFKYMTIASLYNPFAIYAGESCWWQYLTLTGIGLSFMGIGVIVFHKKDLPI